MTGEIENLNPNILYNTSRLKIILWNVCLAIVISRCEIKFKFYFYLNWKTFSRNILIFFLRKSWNLLNCIEACYNIQNVYNEMKSDYSSDKVHNSCIKYFLDMDRTDKTAESKLHSVYWCWESTAHWWCFYALYGRYS